MFERISDDALRMQTAALAEAAAMGHAELGDDHLLLAVAMGNDLAADLVAQRVSVRDLHAHVAGAHRQTQRPEGHVPLTKGAKATWERALPCAERLGHHEVQTVDVLLAMLEVKGEARRALKALGVDVDELRRETERVATGDPTGEEAVQAWSEHIIVEEAFAGPIGVRGPARPWPSPRCHGCRALLSDHMQLRTMEVPDAATGAVERFRFLYCGACGTALAIERIDR